MILIKLNLIMSRDKIVAGNWKMNNDFNQTQTLILELKKTMQMDVNVMIAPSFTNLTNWDSANSFDKYLPPS